MKKITQDMPFNGDILRGQNGKIFALTNKRTETNTDEQNNTNTSYVADGLLIDNINNKDEVIKQYELDNIVTENNFYGDSVSRIDMLTPVVLMLAQTLDKDMIIPVDWKTKDGNKKDLTVGDFLDAIQDSLSKKGNIVL